MGKLTDFLSSEVPNEFNHPHSSVRRWFNFLVFLAVIYNSVTVPLRLAFDLSSPSWYPVDYLLDLVFIVDVTWHFFMGYVNQGALVLDRDEVWRHYTRGMFAFDVAGTLPIDLVFAFAGKYSYASIARGLRMVRLVRVRAYFQQWEFHTPFAYLTRLLKFLGGLFLIGHWVACGFYYIVAWERLIPGYSDDFGWAHAIFTDSSRRRGLAFHYFKSLFWAITLLTGMGPDHNQPNTDVELAYMFCIIILAILVFATIIGEVGSIVAHMNHNEMKFREQMDTLNQWLAHREISPALAKNIRSYYEYLYSKQKGIVDSDLLDEFPMHLRKDASLEMRAKLIHQVDFFESSPEGLVAELVMRLHPIIFSPRDYICKVGEAGDAMYFISQGEIEVIANGVVVNLLKEGGFFGEIAILTGQARTATCRARSFVEVMCLHKKDVDDVLVDFPEVKEYIASVAEGRLARDRNQKMKDDVVKAFAGKRTFARANSADPDSHPEEHQLRITTNTTIPKEVPASSHDRTSEAPTIEVTATGGEVSPPPPAPRDQGGEHAGASHLLPPGSAAGAMSAPEGDDGTVRTGLPVPPWSAHTIAGVLASLPERRIHDMSVEGLVRSQRSTALLMSKFQQALDESAQRPVEHTVEETAQPPPPSRVDVPPALKPHAPVRSIPLSQVAAKIRDDKDTIIRNQCAVIDRLSSQIERQRESLRRKARQQRRSQRPRLPLSHLAAANPPHSHSHSHSHHMHG